MVREPLFSGGARPIRLPSRPRAVLPIVVVAFAAVCSTFFAYRVVMRRP